MRPRAFVLLILFFSSPALADIRAVYSSSMGGKTVVEVADSGDMRIETNSGLDLIVRGNELYAIDERLTGPIVSRGEDLLDAWRERAGRWNASKEERGSELAMKPGGEEAVNGRAGTAYFMWYGQERNPGGPILVMSADPALKPLGRAMALVLRMRLERVAGSSAEGERNSVSIFSEMIAIVEAGAPLAVNSDKLVSVEAVRLAPERFALPAEPESRDALKARLAREARSENERPRVRPESMTSGAIFSRGRLWLWNDFGTLSSVAENETARRQERPGGFVLSLCTRVDGPLALTANGKKGTELTFRAYRDDGWHEERSLKRAKDEALVAMSCGSDGALLVTSSRLILAGSEGVSQVALSSPLQPALVKPSVHVTAGHVYLGINAGEWGGGLMRIDRRDGRIAKLERNANGGLCDGPLNSGCDPVNGIADIPWKPGCVVAAIGLIHMMAHGRVAEICGERIESFFAKSSLGTMVEGPVAAGQSDFDASIAFFGIVRSGDSLLAAGHDGIYRFRAGGTPSFQPLPRFREVDGVLVSYGLPDAVLLITMINQRASMSGAAPIIVPR